MVRGLAPANPPVDARASNADTFFLVPCVYAPDRELLSPRRLGY
jgi:hypothetical protein